jgi:hypothetical protein
MPADERAESKRIPQGEISRGMRPPPGRYIYRTTNLVDNLAADVYRIGSLFESEEC